MTWLGLDIGGANLKAATATGWARSKSFALWKNPDGLVQALSSLVNDAPAFDALALTMTGELCDCFSTKPEGVEHILSAVETVAADRHLAVFLVDGQFVSVREARQTPHLAAASNWRALAEVACRSTHGEAAVLIDIGSTTTDIIPMVDGLVVARGRTDTERLLARELIYSGVGRTPVCALVDTLPIGNTQCPIAAEIFSTTADAYVLLGAIPAEPDATWTADGRPLTVACARQRLARQICGDACEFAVTDFDQMVIAIRDAQLQQLETGIKSVLAAMGRAPGIALLSGTGEFLARTAIENSAWSLELHSLGQIWGPEASQCGPAFAVALLAEERFSRMVPAWP
jgi:(4-(4-[2-(gamma-L-glutamylamino)ethyl]phenoxymethyl)furan-2-yl)methanamine synthase